MGSKQTALAQDPATAPAPPKVFDKPWRNTPWGGKDELLEDLRAYVPCNPDIDVRILLDGPIGAGKSSFINSINNVFQNKITMKAQVDSAMADKSFTTTYKTHKIENRKTGSYYRFVFNDVMGFEKLSGKGVHEDDLIKALRGHVKEGHKFNPSHPLTEGDVGYNTSPSPSDRAHCLVSLIPADKITVMDDDVIKKMRAIRVVASELGIPQMVILSRVDIACPLVKENLTDLYLSKYIKELMEKCSIKLGVPVNCILPVRNYHEEIDLHKDMDVLLLKALKQMVNFGDDFLKAMEQS
ncbi:interferon-induced protein 44-like [Salmo trutta]|uniref:Interferon-induced protein 44-like n=1 Tax=Salmo trutta TaxID=8032 RepID=A0A673YXB9_SALTR|nr:interferon-induced protein 44-like [Salmo trutta]XP_029626631.1 interferon-induced protein 44-like [Salmo trutta]XP_029626640.1 interferon-induced protein 44-like [Salmo trutta]XP_029626648.1 interferon-induced protein 44-like [Salmo trutta]XP_029626656.1 interferon-induced protein 44-like [Salmo trutta]